MRADVRFAVARKGSEPSEKGARPPSDLPELVASSSRNRHVTGMARSRFPWLTRFLFLLAWFQVMGPAVSSVADAWRLDKRDAYVHMESETGPGCVLVHGHDCLLCSVATGLNGTSPDAPRTPITAVRAIAPAGVHVARCERAWRSSASQRAPPVMSV